MVQANDIKKVFSSTGVAAVQNNTFCVKEGEVFGLLGPNGAGKSTTFNVLSLGLKRSSGDAKLNYYLIDDIKSGTNVRAGICPQHNPIWDNLSVDQSLRLLGHMRGIDKQDLDF